MHKIEHMCTVPYDTFSFVQQQNGTDLCSSWLYISQDIPTTHPLTRYVTMPCCGQLANFSCFRPRYKHQSNGIKPDMNGIKDNGARPSRIKGKLKAHYAALHKHVGGMMQLGECPCSPQIRQCSSNLRQWWPGGSGETCPAAASLIAYDNMCYLTKLKWWIWFSFFNPKL